MKAAADELTEVDAVAKGGDDRGLGEGFGGVGDPIIGAEDCGGIGARSPGP